MIPKVNQTRRPKPRITGIIVLVLLQKVHIAMSLWPRSASKCPTGCRIHMEIGQRSAKSQANHQTILVCWKGCYVYGTPWSYYTKVSVYSLMLYLEENLTPMFLQLLLIRCHVVYQRRGLSVNILSKTAVVQHSDWYGHALQKGRTIGCSHYYPHLFSLRKDWSHKWGEKIC